MPSLSLDDLLRYGFAGAVFLAALLLEFSEPRMALAQGKDFAGAAAAGAGVVGLVAGSLIYSFHRAAPFPLLYKLFAILSRRRGTLVELDIVRWRSAAKPLALQPHLRAWAAQIHYLYCIAWSCAGALLLGARLGWTPSPTGRITPLLLAGALVCAMIHHYRYQRWEARVVEEDSQLRS